jgi:hypothetical protein
MVEFDELGDFFSIDKYTDISILTKSNPDLSDELETATLIRATTNDSLNRLKQETVCQNNILEIIASQKHAYVSSAISHQSSTEDTGLPLEIFIRPKMNAQMANRPANDLQLVHEKFMNRPREYYGREFSSLPNYFASIGDMQSMKVLIQYGQNIDKAPSPQISRPIQLAMNLCRYEMVKFLADNGAITSQDDWIIFMEAKGDRLQIVDSSQEKIEILKYLLKNIAVNFNPGHQGTMLVRALALQANDLKEQSYKDDIIKMLLDRGAKLSN